MLLVLLTQWYIYVYICTYILSNTPFQTLLILPKPKPALENHYTPLNQKRFPNIEVDSFKWIENPTPPPPFSSPPSLPSLHLEWGVPLTTKERVWMGRRREGGGAWGIEGEGKWSLVSYFQVCGLWWLVVGWLVVAVDSATVVAAAAASVVNSCCLIKRKLLFFSFYSIS